MDSKSKDNMELRSQKVRDSYQFEKLRKIIDLAKSNSEGWKSILAGIKSDSIKERNDLIALAVFCFGQIAPVSGFIIR